MAVIYKLYRHCFAIKREVSPVSQQLLLTYDAAADKAVDSPAPPRSPDRSLGPCYAACRWTRHRSCVPVDADTRYTVAGRPSPLLFDDVSDGRSVRMPL